MKTQITSAINSAREYALDIARKASLAVTTPTEKQAQMILFAAGIAALGLGLSDELFAQGFVDNDLSNAAAGRGEISDSRIAAAVNVLFSFLEGSFGALIMAASGIAAIVAAAFGQYKAALSCMVCAVGAFILRSLMNTFFNIQSVEQFGSVQ